MNATSTPNKIIYYLGSDTGYFQNIVQRYHNTYGVLKFEFQTSQFSSEPSPEKKLLEILKIKPCIIYIDFCKNPLECKALCQMITQDPAFASISVVGLIDKKEAIPKLVGSGADFMYVKGGEHFDMVFAPMLKVFRKHVKTPKFAEAKLNHETSLYDDFRVGYIAPTYVHLEGNLWLKEGSHITLHHDMPVANVPSKDFVVKNRRTDNLYQDLKYSYDFDIQFLDKPKPPSEADFHEGVSPEEAERENKKYEEEIANYKDNLGRYQKRHKEWVIDKLDESRDKKTKVLVVDKSLRPYENLENEKLKRLPYVINFRTDFNKRMEILEKKRPSIIAYQIMGEYSQAEEREFQEALAILKNHANDVDPSVHIRSENKKLVKVLMEQIPRREKEELNKIKEIIDRVKSIENYAPIIVLFRCYFQTSKALQESFIYPMIMTHSENISLDICLNLASMYERKQLEKKNKIITAKVQQLKKKDPVKYRRLSEADFHEKKYFIREADSMAYGAVSLPVRLYKINESILSIQTELDLPLKTYRLEYPIPLSVHLIPVDGKPYVEEKGVKTYKGIIHSISENDKMTLRQFVNEIIFKPLKEARELEQQKFDELNARAKKNDEVKPDMADDESGIEDEDELGPEGEVGT